MDQDGALHGEWLESGSNCPSKKLLIPGHPNVLRKFKEGRAEDDSLELDVRVTNQEGVNDQAAHRVAVEKRGDALLELPQQTRQIVVKLFNVGSLAAHTRRITVGVRVD